MKNISKEDGHDHHSDCDCEDRGYLLEYPLDQRKRIAALENLKEERFKVQAELNKEIQELERKYLAKFQPINDNRAAIISGEREPSPEEYGTIPEDSIIEVDDKGEKISQAPESKGIPEFWVTALKNHPGIGNLISDEDVKALKHLKDIRVGFLENGPGFRLEFVFTPNEFFNNQILTKEYYLVNPSVLGQSEMVYDHATGTEIDWKDGKNLCFKTVTKTQRQKNGHGTRVVKRQEPVESFFHFFNPASLPEDDSEADIEELEEELEADYEAGDIIKTEIIPNAIDWFTGKALEYADYYDDEEYDDESEFESGDEEDTDEEDSDADSNDSDEEKPLKHGKPRSKKHLHHQHGDQQNCKQQ